MSDKKQDKLPSNSSKSTDSKPISITKIDIGGIKNGRVTSEAPTKPEKPSKGHK